VIAGFFGILIWALSWLTPRLSVGDVPRLSLVVSLFVLGGVFAFSGLLAFRRAATTVDPLKPHRASSLVATGIYRFTRNPMYVGLALVLTSWDVYLGSPLASLGVMGFVAYINWLQIIPEEQALLELFGDEYREYQARVRRWL
jgi:protein-S-isoprenylcysteine O-methyltransferase Ste14